MKGNFEKLREKFDGSDPFMSGGHQIIKSAGATRHDTRVSNVPEWALDDSKVQTLLLTSFPKLKTDDIQRKRAGRWLQIIHLYYRMGWTQNKIAGEMSIEINLLKYYLTAIKRAAKGLTVDGVGRGIKPRGRPRKYPTL